jgi:hypothetical protein
VIPASEIEYVHGEWLRSEHMHDPYGVLGKLAVNHAKFQKLDVTLLEVDAPLTSYMEKAAHDELVQKLSIPLGNDIARKLAVTPFFTHKSMPKSSVSREILKLVSGSIFDHGSKIWIETKKVIIETFYPDKINPEWRNNCELELIRPSESKAKPPILKVRISNKSTSARVDSE